MSNTLGVTCTVSHAQMAVGALPGVSAMPQPTSPAPYNPGVMSVGSPVQVCLFLLCQSVVVQDGCPEHGCSHLVPPFSW